MSAFVSDSDQFDLTVHYIVEKNGDVRIISDPSANSDDESEKKEENNESKAESLTITFDYPNFVQSQEILQRCTMMNESGLPVVNFMSLQNSLLFVLSDKWDATDENGEELPISTNLGKLKPAVAQSFVVQLYDKIGTDVMP